MEEGRMEGEGKAGFLTMGGEIVSPRLRVNLVQLSAGWKERERKGERERIGADLQLSFDISRCRRDTAAPDKRRESRGHNLVSFLTRSQGARALYSQSLPTRLVTDKHRHDSNETSGSVLRRSFEYTRAFSLSLALALSLCRSLHLRPIAIPATL